MALERFCLWIGSDAKGPLELIVGSEMSVNGFDRLAEESGIEENWLDSAARWLLQ